MKRLNPKTNTFFKQGDIREDGYIFVGYKTSRQPKKTPYFTECWVNPVSFTKNLEDARKRVLNWQNKNPQKNCAKSGKRRSNKLNATPKWFTESHKQAIEAVYKECYEISKQTGLKHHVDHIVPLKGKTVCGLHVPWNLQILSALDNYKKGNRI